MTKNYRKLDQEEISILSGNGCSAENWDEIKVEEGFSPGMIRNTRFGKKVYIGARAEIDSVRYLSCYIIGQSAVLHNIDYLATDGISSFGNGTHVNLLNETGARAIRIFDDMSAQTAYVFAMYRHRPTAITAINNLIDIYVNKISSDVGIVGAYTKIENCGYIKNIRTGEDARIKGASELKNGTVNSTSEAPSRIGRNVIMRNFITSSSARITDGAVVEKCFVGQGCEITKGFSAEHSFFSANCFLANGEAVSVFAGPYTVSHHKSSLLIGGMFSFFNAGSESNQSNHYYRLGPVHQGVMERGCKTGSGSYILFPARIGAFSVVKGRHNTNLDTSLLPFSYLIEYNGDTIIVPGANLGSVGAARDAMKWPKRDMRKGVDFKDRIVYKMFNPYIVGKMVQAIEILKDLSPKFVGKEYVNYNGAKIKTSSIKKAINLYNLAIDKYLGGIIAAKLNNSDWKNAQDVADIMDAGSRSNYGEWCDVAGLITPVSIVDMVVHNIERGTIYSIEELNGSFLHVEKNYREFEWIYVVRLLASRLGKAVNEITAKNLIPVLERWKKSVAVIDAMLCDDASKEFSAKTMISYGIDGDEDIKKADFAAVRGSYDHNYFVKGTKDHTHRKAVSADRLIDALWKM